LKIHLKSVLIIGAMAIILLSLLSFSTYSMILAGFSEIETKETLGNIALAQRIIGNDLSELETTASDWAWWDDTYSFMGTMSQSYIDSTLADASLQNIHVNVILFIDTNGSLWFGKAVNLTTGDGVELPPSIAENLSYFEPLTVFNGTARHSGVLIIGETPALFSSSPILTTDREGPSAGTLIMIRYFDEVAAARISSILNMSFEAVNYNSPSLSPDFAEAKASLSPSGTFVKIVSEDTISGFAELRDPYGDPAILFRMDMSRALSALKGAALFYFLLSTFGISIMAVLIALLLLRWAIILRISRLSSEVSQIASSKSFESRVAESGEDEIYALAHDINGMLLALQNSQITLKEYSEHLEDLVNEKTKQLKEAERLATIGETAAMVGHDLKSPLQAAVNTLYLAKETLGSMKLDEKDMLSMDEYCDRLSKYLSYMNRIVSDLQDFARPLKPEYAWVDLRRLLSDSLNTIQVPKGVGVSVDVAEGFPKVRADPLLMQRLSTNLANNAVQAMPDGGALRISARLSGGSLTLKFSDTGVGISEENLGKLFVPLFTTKSKGSGLGLAICKRIAEAQGGTIAVESKVGAGTAFTVTIPQPP
jgi:signal transduction histidine kinase